MNNENKELSLILENIRNREHKNKIIKKRFFIYLGILLIIYLYLRLFNTVFINDDDGSVDFKYSTAWYIHYPAWQNDSPHSYASISSDSAPHVLYVYIEDGIKNIYNFRSNTLLGVRLPKTLGEIGRTAFEGNKNMRWVSFPKEMQGELSIGDYAFYESGITSLELPFGTTRIGEKAFAYCDSLKQASIPEGVEELSSYTFLGCTALEYVELPDDMEHIPNFFFAVCASLKEISYPTNLRSIPPSALSHSGLWKKSIYELNLPDTVFFATTEKDNLFNEAKELQYLSEQTGIPLDIFTKSLDTSEVWIEGNWYSMAVTLEEFMEKDSWEIVSTEEGSNPSPYDTEVTLKHVETGRTLVLLTVDDFVCGIDQNYRNDANCQIVFPCAIVSNLTRWYRPVKRYNVPYETHNEPSLCVPFSVEYGSYYHMYFDTDEGKGISNGAITNITYYVDSAYYIN